jgi:hypothetical protein
MERLLEHPTVGDQALPVADRADEGVDGGVNDGSSGALAGQPDQRRAVTVVSLGAPRADLGPGRLGL